MNRNTLTLFFCFLFTSFKLAAQTDAYAGTWFMQTLPEPGKSIVSIELQIALSEKNILYPAHLKLQCDSFSAEYELLLVRKDIRQLGISTNKFPVFEKPFSMGSAVTLLNGVFDCSRNLKGTPTLTAIRISSKQFGIPVKDTMQLSKVSKKTYMRLREFLKDEDMRLIKISDSAWNDEEGERILSPHLSPAYFGLLDTVHLQNRGGTMELLSDKKTPDDTVSVMLNGAIAIDQLLLNKKKHAEEILVDTGLNILVLFADNFGSGLPNKGKLNLDFENKKLSLDFNNKQDSGSTFIVSKLYFDQDESQDKNFQVYNPPAGEMHLQKNEKLISSIVATDKQITFAVWDDAVEDGDSISINIDGKWLVQGFPVKNKPQFIPVTLKAGANTITFLADNLGSIPPNTSVLEIIDGNKRKSFNIETTPEEKNYIKIFYEEKD